MSFGSRSLPPMTAEESSRVAEIKARGCLLCLRRGFSSSAEYHHLLKGGLRIGHRYGIGLCGWHHKGDTRSLWLGLERGPSLAWGAQVFHAHYGSPQTLLNEQDDLIGWPRIQIPARRIREASKRPTRAAVSQPRLKSTKKETARAKSLSARRPDRPKLSSVRSPSKIFRRVLP